MTDQRPEPAGPPADRRLRVLWLIKGLGPGGAEHLLVSHARVSDATRFRYDAAYVVPWKNQLVPDLEALGVHCRCLGVGRRGGLRWPLRVASLVRSGGYDVVHAHSPLLATAARLAARTLPRRRRPAMVSTEHNVWERYATVTRWVNAVTCRLDDHRWAVSERVAASCGAHAADRTSVLVHGVVHEDLEVAPETRQRVRDELGLDPAAVTVVTVANLREQKDYPNLLQAAQQVLADNPDVVFLAAGQGPLEDMVKALHRDLRLGDRFRLLGYRADVPGLLAAGDVFVLASKYEGYPLAVMEALSLGLPVVSTNVGGVPDTVVDGVQGLLVPPGRPELLAAALTRLVRDPALRRAMAAEGVVAGEQFDIRTAVRVQEEAYCELVGFRPPADPVNSGIVA
jgi:glycosyltransferase involved in cell wall biosynthesis